MTQTQYKVEGKIQSVGLVSPYRNLQVILFVYQLALIRELAGRFFPDKQKVLPIFKRLANNGVSWEGCQCYHWILPRSWKSDSVC